MKKLNLRTFLEPEKQLLFSIIFSSLIIITISLFEIYSNQIVELSHIDIKEIIIIQIQINTVTVGLFIAFFFFWSQSLESNRNTNYSEYRKTVNKIIDFYSNLPDKYKDFEKPLVKIIQFINQIKENDFPLKPEDRKIIEKTAKRTVKIANKNNDNESFKLLWYLSELEHYINKIGVCFVGFTIMSIALNCIKKQIILIIFLILIAITYTFIYSPDYKILLGIVIITLTLTISSLSELLYFIKYYYRNLDAEWHKYEKNSA